ncbi:MAG: helicase, partial [Beijerinckiaceae bacterium]|nr:helicase [Beijerinckiaceae bacterium]
MARKRAQPTVDLLKDVVARLGLPPRSVDIEALRLQLDLPEFGGHVEDARVGKALRRMKAQSAFARTGSAAVSKSVPGLKVTVAESDTLLWRVRVLLPLLDGNRLDVRVEAPLEGVASEIVAGMAERNDPTWRIETLRPAVAESTARTGQTLHSAIERLRDAITGDLREVGADAVTYIDHMDRSLRSRVFHAGPNLGRSMSDTLAPVRKRAKVVAREDSRLRRLRDQVGFGAYIEKFKVARRLGRRIIFHMGPTNSGKTYAALQLLAAAPTGTYLAPLRLLALENYEGLAERGLKAGMVTGEEILGEDR